MERPNRESFLPVLRGLFPAPFLLPEKQFFLLATSHIPLKRIGQALLRKLPAGLGIERVQ